VIKPRPPRANTTFYAAIGKLQDLETFE